MSLRNKRRLKRLLSKILGLIILAVAIAYAYYKHRTIEAIISIALFYVYRHLFIKQWHANSLYACFIVTSIVLLILINIELPLNLSVLCSVLITFILTLISYYLKDYIDSRKALQKYENKYKELSTTPLEHISIETLHNLFPDINDEVIQIVYNYIHKDKSITANYFANANYISEIK